ncbi:MAG: arylesterase [Luteitalea sp.]|nr:arylesterase [Luteitalea sp.]
MTLACPRLPHWCAATLLLIAAACGGNDASNDTRGTAEPAVSAVPATPETRAGRDPSPRPDMAGGRPRVVALGDSLTAGLGLKPEAAYPALLQRRLDEEGVQYEVVNAGVSGDTSAGGLSRLDWALDGDVRVLIVALGGNDALRGLPVEQLRRNLSTIIERAQTRQIEVLLAGMEAPPNFGQSYTVSFHEAYADLARQYDVAFVPFLLERVAGIASLNQRDGIHPTAEGARIVADNVWRALRPMLQ